MATGSYALRDGSGAGDEDADPKASLVQSIANEYASADARIKYECLTENQGIAGKYKCGDRTGGRRLDRIYGS